MCDLDSGVREEGLRRLRERVSFILLMMSELLLKSLKVLVCQRGSWTRYTR